MVVQPVIINDNLTMFIISIKLIFLGTKGSKKTIQKRMFGYGGGIG